MAHHNNVQYRMGDRPPHGYAPHMRGPPGGMPQYRNAGPEPFVLDRFGINPMNPPEIPAYRVINEVPLPCKRDKRGLVVSLLRCFNCGASDHKLQDCKQQFHRDLVNMNKSWMNDYARIGQKKQKEMFNARYFVGKNTKAELPDFSKNGDSESAKKASVAEAEPELLQVWTDAKDIVERQEEAPRPPPRRQSNRPPASKDWQNRSRPRSRDQRNRMNDRGRYGPPGHRPVGQGEYNRRDVPRGPPPSAYGQRGYPYPHGPGHYHNPRGPTGPYHGPPDHHGYPDRRAYTGHRGHPGRDRRPGGNHGPRYRRGARY